LNILIISQYFWPENFRINDLAQELANRGHRVSVLTGLPNYPNGRVFNEYRNDPELPTRFKVKGLASNTDLNFMKASNKIRMYNYLTSLLII
jgi:hypothetical protein